MEINSSIKKDYYKIHQVIFRKYIQSYITEKNSKKSSFLPYLYSLTLLCNGLIFIFYFYGHFVFSSPGKFLFCSKLIVFVLFADSVFFLLALQFILSRSSL